MNYVKKIHQFGLLALTGIFMAALLCNSYIPAFAADKEEAQSIVDKSKGTVNDLMNDNVFSWLREYLKNAKGVLVFPQVLKAGFFLGGSGGTGVFLLHDMATGTWGEPAFYTVGSVTFGLQIGGEAAEVVMVAMNQKAIDSLLTSTAKLGGDISVAIGPIGGGAKGAMTVPEVRADFVSFTRAKGLYGGLNLEGSVLGVRDALNHAYYGKAVAPKDIFDRKVANPGSSELRAALKNASAK